MQTQYVIFCHQANHGGNEIIGYCSNILCQKKRLFCFDCMKDVIHGDHNKDLFKMNKLMELDQEQGKTKKIGQLLLQQLEEITSLVKKIVLEIAWSSTIDLNSIDFEQLNDYIQFKLKTDYIDIQGAKKLEPITKEITSIAMKLNHLLKFVEMEKQTKNIVSSLKTENEAQGLLSNERKDIFVWIKRTQ